MILETAEELLFGVFQEWSDAVFIPLRPNASAEARRSRKWKRLIAGGIWLIALTVVISVIYGHGLFQAKPWTALLCTLLVVSGFIVPFFIKLLIVRELRK